MTAAVRLPLLTSVRPIYTGLYFWGTFLFTVCVTFAANYFVDKSKLEGVLSAHDDDGISASVATFAGRLPLTASIEAGFPSTDFRSEVFGFVLITSCLVFFGAGSVRKRIIDGKAAAVVPHALTNSFLKRAFLFSIGIANWKLRLAGLIVQTLLFAGFPVVLVGQMLVAESNTQAARMRELSATEFLLATATWKACIAAYCFIVNYAGFHNADQPELQHEPTKDALRTEGDQKKTK